MGLRPARCYRGVERAYTRVATRVQAKDFIGGVPRTRVRQFVLGDQTKNFEKTVHIISDENIQIRDNALESFRQKLAKMLGDICGKDNFFAKIRIFPHHILRQNKLASGAGADRLSSGMKHAFGKPVGRSAQIRKGQIIVSLVINSEFVKKVIPALKATVRKMGLRYHTIIEEHKDMKLTGRKKWTRELKKAAAEEEAPKEEEKAPAKDAKGKGATGKAGAKEEPKTEDTKDTKGRKKK
jgi:large subunit ribosomal protein L10e